jgi:hypothetical protein
MFSKVQQIQTQQVQTMMVWSLPYLILSFKQYCTPHNSGQVGANLILVNINKLKPYCLFDTHSQGLES